MPLDADAQGSLTNFSMAATPSTNAPTNLEQGPGLPSLTTEERETPKSPTDKWTNTYAAQIALGDFQKMEAYRTINHDWRFRVSDQLYLAWTQRKTWEGTKIPRSSVGIFTALEQIEALLPSVVLALFPDNNRLPFDAEPLPGTTIQQAQSVRDLISWQLQDVGKPGKYLTLRELTRRSYKNAYVYGHGPVEFGAIDQQVVQNRFIRHNIPVRQTIAHPLTGEPVNVPTGQFRSMVERVQQLTRIVRPLLNPIDPRDYYWDPNCSSPNPNDGSMCATRHLLTVDQFEALRHSPGVTLPSPTELVKLCQIKSMSQGDATKMNQESFRGMTYQPTIDYTVSPNLMRGELIRYWNKNRHIWLISRQWVAYNAPNEFNLLPFINASYVDVPGRFAGLSICDLVEGDQKLAEAIINARIDELNLMIHRPLIVKEGRAFSASQQRLRPGVIWKVEDPTSDIKWMDSKPVTQDAYLEVSALENRVQKKTGVTDLAVLGTPSAGGNSANRTATGISSQEGASGKRIQYHVENAEDQFIVPALNILHALNQVFLPMDQMIQVLGPESQTLTIDPVDIMNASVRFRMNASGKLRIKNALAAGGLGLIIQTYLNPELDSLAFQQGKRVSLRQIDRIICDTFGLPPMSLWEDMDPQTMQQTMQLKMAPFMMKLQEQGQRLQSHEKVAGDRDETQLLKTLLDRLLTPQAAHALLDEYTGSDLSKLDLMAAQPAPQGNGTSSNKQ